MNSLIGIQLCRTSTIFTMMAVDRWLMSSSFGLVLGRGGRGCTFDQRTVQGVGDKRRGNWGRIVKEIGQERPFASFPSAGN